jgi:hypothetical protein
MILPPETCGVMTELLTGGDALDEISLAFRGDIWRPRLVETHDATD